MDINFKNDALALVGIKSTDPEIEKLQKQWRQEERNDVAE